MRPQLYTADAIARLTALPFPRPSARIDQPSGGFDSILKEVRSTREALRRKAERSEPSPENDDALEESGEEDGSQAPAGQDVSSTERETGAEAAPVVAPQPSPSNGQPAQPEQQKPAAAEGVSAAAQSAASVVQTGVTSVDGISTKASDGESSSKAGQSVAESGEQKATIVSPSDVTASFTAQQDDVPSQAISEAVSVPTVKNTKNPRGFGGDQGIPGELNDSRADAQQPQQARAEPQPAAQSESPDSAVKGRLAKDDDRARIGQGTGDQLRLGGSKEDKRALLLAGGKGESKGEEATATKGGDNRPAAERSRASGHVADTNELAKSVGFRFVQGDSTAESIARFLISTPGGSPTTAHSTPGASGQLQVTSASSVAASRAVQTVGGPASSVMAGAIPSDLTATGSLDTTARVLSAAGGDGRFHVTMQLDPPELGQLRLQIRMEQHTMTMQVDADTPASARLIESRLSDLRDALAAHGIRLDRNDVVVRSPAWSDSNPQTHDGGQNGSAQHGRGEPDGSGGWLPDGRQMGSSPEQGSSGGGMDGDYGQVNDSGAGAALADDGRADGELISTTELSLDLVA